MCQFNLGDILSSWRWQISEILLEDDFNRDVSFGDTCICHYVGSHAWIEIMLLHSETSHPSMVFIFCCGLSISTGRPNDKAPSPRDEIISLGWWIRHIPLSEPDTQPPAATGGNSYYFTGAWTTSPRLLIRLQPTTSLCFSVNMSCSIPLSSFTRVYPICAL